MELFKTIPMELLINPSVNRKGKSAWMQGKGSWMLKIISYLKDGTFFEDKRQQENYEYEQLGTHCKTTFFEDEGIHSLCLDV